MYKSRKIESGSIDDQKILVELTLGQREPRNDYERRLLKEIQEIKKSGQAVDIPQEIS